MDGLSLVIVGMVTNNLLLERLVGLDVAVALSRKLDVALGMVVSSMLIFPFAALAASTVDAALLGPAGLVVLRPIVLPLIVLVVLMGAESVLARRADTWQKLRPYFALQSLNASAWGAVLVALELAANPLAAFAVSVGGGLGFGLTLLTLAGLRERLASSPIPKAFQGAPITCLTLALLSIGIGGFVGR